ncbi:hypothetical protein ACIP5Y_23610 [Nocardia sp. NPDC088792]|uniref:hypothetical protein n=1 Tax=Nocardia sp. NPDC088792 TaxID=3364332 RepID=UPI003803BCE5
MADKHMRKTVRNRLAAAALGAAAATTAFGAGQAHADPIINYGGSLGDLSLDHYNEFAPGAFLGGNQIRFGNDLPPVYAGLLVDLAPFDQTCVDAKIVVHPDAAPDRDIPLARSCGLPTPYLVLGDRPAAEFRTTCPTTDINGAEAARTCFYHQ